MKTLTELKQDQARLQTEAGRILQQIEQFNQRLQNVNRDYLIVTGKIEVLEELRNNSGGENLAEILADPEPAEPEETEG